MDGTLIQAWAGQKSFQRKGTTPPPPDDPGNPTVNFHGEKRTNATHAPITDSDALPFKKAKGQVGRLKEIPPVPGRYQYPWTRVTARPATSQMAPLSPTSTRALSGAARYAEARLGAA